MTQFELECGTEGVLKPGRWLWLRAVGWMLLGFALLLIVPGLAYVLMTPGATEKGHLPELPGSIVMAAVAVALYVGYVRLGERRWPGELAVRRLGDLAGGLVLGAVMMSAVMGLLVLFDWYELRRTGDASPVTGIAISIQSGVVEELLFRGIMLRLLTRAFNVWWALALSSALFGAVHMGNPDATVLGAVAIAVEAGLSLGALYIWTGRLWLPIGVHAAWNFFQGYVYGAVVSGTDFGDSPMEAIPDPRDPELLTGGIFGPEATLASILVWLAVAAVVLWLARAKLRRQAAAPTESVAAAETKADPEPA